MPPLNVKIHTFGCQMNRLDSDLMEEALFAAGHRVVEDEDAADLVVYNTCSVREHAEERVEQRVRQLPGRALVAIAGCLAERLGDKLFAMLPRVNIVVGTKHFPEIADLAARAAAGEKRVLAVGEGENAAPGVAAAHERSRHHGIEGYVSVMRGCDNFCAYCIVPYVRGREESRPAGEIVREACNLAARGAVEITLLGQNIDAYGKHGGPNLAELLRRLDDAVPASVRRFRCVTSHPRDITPELVQTVAERPRLAKHFHMPAQSGSTRVLQAMRRGYDRATYDGRLAMIRELCPGALVTSDFIVGFPGETDADFAMTEDLFRQARFQTAYVFKYSPRPGTWSEKNLPDDVPLAVKKERNFRLLKLQESIALERHQGLVGKTLGDVLVDGVSPRDPGKMLGRTSANLAVVFPAPADGGARPGDMVAVRVGRVSPLTLFGELAAPGV